MIHKSDGLKHTEKFFREASCHFARIIISSLLSATWY